MRIKRSRKRCVPRSIQIRLLCARLRIVSSSHDESCSATSDRSAIFFARPRGFRRGRSILEDGCARRPPGEAGRTRATVPHALRTLSSPAFALTQRIPIWIAGAKVSDSDQTTFLTPANLTVDLQGGTQWRTLQFPFPTGETGTVSTIRFARNALQLLRALCRKLQ
jgi:hypothetical protein